jgi:hypothetical protein
LGGKTVCVEVEVVDPPLDYNLLLGMSWTYVMHAVVAMIFWIFCFPHEGQIVTIDQLSFSRTNPLSGASMVLMIDSLQPDTVNLGAGCFPSLMGTFDYLPPSSDVNLISTSLDQPRDAILQVLLFQTRYFNDPWTLPSPSASMEWTGNPGMAMPLPATEFAYNIVQPTLANPDPTPTQELDTVLEPIWAQGYLATQHPLDLVFPSDEMILEALTGPNRPWDDIHHRSYFLPELRRIEVREFVSTMNGDSSYPINPLAKNKFYVEGNMEIIATMIPIDISKTRRILENVFIRGDCSPEEIQTYTKLLKEL